MVVSLAGDAALEFIVKLLRLCPPLLALANRFLINLFAYSTPPRPHPFSLWSPTDAKAPAPKRFPTTQAPLQPHAPPSWVSDYTSWIGLADRNFTGRHLPPRPEHDSRRVPPEHEVLALFKRSGAMQPNPRSSLLFCFFAQWFTDSFLRTDPTDPRRTTSNHEIDLCQIYGLDEPSTWALRQGEGGRLKSRLVDGQEYPCLLYKDGQLDPQFFDPNPVDQVGLTYLRGGRAPFWEKALDATLSGATTDPERRDWFYTSGLDRGGSTILYSAFNTIFLREHNRIAGVLSRAHSDWGDDRLFETARVISIRQMLTIVMNDYIRHIAGVFPISLDRTFGEKERWYRPNRISIEFDLLYRWHSLVPETFLLAGAQTPQEKYRFNNKLLEQHGVERVISDASRQRAGRIGLFNTPDFLWRAEQHGLKWAREFRMESFNAYRARFNLTPYTSIDEMADSPAVATALKAVYGDDVNAVEFTVGLFAEKRDPGQVMPQTLIQIVALDAFTHILTNPLLASEVHCEATFSPEGWEIINAQATLVDVIKRNTDPTKQVFASLEFKG